MSNFRMLTALPDKPYYEWQLEIQFLNLLDLGYDLSNYHVLVGYRGAVSPEMQVLSDRYPGVRWGFYEDSRKETRSYVSSIRPHIIAKHFEVNAELEGERVFFIDTDVIFRCLPGLQSLNNEDTWYYSRADYIGLEGIRDRGDHILTDMCRIVGVQRELVETGPDHGGAQIWLNGTNAQFWRDMELKCTLLHDYLKLTQPIAAKIWSELHNKPAEEYKAIHPYMADMWAMLWIPLTLRKKVSVEPLLDFCRPSEPLSRWDECFLLHYSLMNGCNEPEYFLKSRFTTGIDLNWLPDGIAGDVCARKYVDYIEQLIRLRKGLKSCQ